MKQTWRWFGPQEPTSIENIVQAGVHGIVSALHHVDNGEVWSPEEIEKRQREVSHYPNGELTGLNWDVVESLVASEDIKKQNGSYKQHYANYRTSMENLAARGIKTICYNFMPVIDWTRTDLAWRLPTGGTAMRFDSVDFAAFDIHLLQRAGALEEAAPELREQAAERFQAMSEPQKDALIKNIVAGLPGSNEKLTLEQIRDHLKEYDDISKEQLTSHLIDFLGEVVPKAEELGIRLCCHPDDPPFPLMGLPRVTSTASDYRKILSAVDSLANGMTFCSGSLGARHDNDMVAIIEEFAAKIHFVHLRAVKRNSNTIPCSFFEDEHLAGDIDMVAVIAALLAEEKRRANEGRLDAIIPMRPDHGQDIVDDLKRAGMQPGYPIIGRLKGLAEIRGVMTALQHMG